MVKIIGYWWFGGSNNIKFNLDKFFIESLEDIKKVIKKREGAIIKLNDKIEIKKEAGSWNFFIKGIKGRYKRLRAKNFRKILKKI